MVTTVAFVEVALRPAVWWLDARRHEQAALGAVEDVRLRRALKHDFVDPDTRISYEYDMFVGWRARPNQQGLTYSIDAAGHRNVPDSSSATSETVLLTGGSAAWSYGASDDAHTIAADLQRRLRATGRDARVLNFAEQAYGLRQEEQVVLDALTSIKPKVVVFIDGVNDAHTVSLGRDPNHYRTYTEFTALLEEALRQVSGSVLIIHPRDIMRSSMLLRGVGALYRLTWRGSQVLARVTDEQRRMLRSFFNERLAHLNAICSKQGVPVVFALQPIIFVSRSPVGAERELASQPDRLWWQDAYVILQDVYQTLGTQGGLRTVDLTRVVRDEGRQVYIDPVHMTDAGYDDVAAGLFAAVNQALGS
jgi:lysophospholipase L1-like esterase